MKCTEVKMLNVPNFDQLAKKDILEFAKAYPEVWLYLPVVPREYLKFPRSYLCNIVYTVVKFPFFQWVDARVKARNAKI